MNSVSCFVCGCANPSGARTCRCGAQLPRFSYDCAPTVRDIAYAGETTTSSFGSAILSGLRRRQVLALEGVMSVEEFAEYLEVAGEAILADAEAYLAAEGRAMNDYREVAIEALERPLTDAEEELLEEYANGRSVRLETMVTSFGEAFETLLDFCATGDDAQAQRGLYLAEQAVAAYEGLPELQSTFLANLLGTLEPVLSAC